MVSTLKVTQTVQMFQMREHNKVMREAHLETMKQIRDLYLPFHFENVAFQRYPGVFANRSQRWRRIKRRKVHHERPNVWTGALRRSVLTESVVRSTPNRGTLTAKGPQDSVMISGRNKGKRIRRPLTEQRRKELEYVSDEERLAQMERQRLFYLNEVQNPARQAKVLKEFR